MGGWGEGGGGCGVVWCGVEEGRGEERTQIYSLGKFEVQLWGKGWNLVSGSRRHKDGKESSGFT